MRTGDWWDEAVVYEVYVRSFGDSDGDGVGDLAGVAQHLDHLVDLGVDGLWLTPFYRSPMADHGYDVADPRDVEPLFGTLTDFDALAAAVRRLELRLVVDVVPNHTSSERDWFIAALRSAPGSPERVRYVFRDGRGPDGALPPNNWPSVFGGPAWTRVEDDGQPGQWYLHLFAPEQPDLDWSQPEVLADLLQTLRFWVGRGVDGFRIDVAHGLAKEPGLPDMAADAVVEILQTVRDDPRFDQPAVHESWRAVRKTLDELGAMAVGEVWVEGQESLARYVRDDELNLAFDFRLLLSGWEPEQLRAAVEGGLAVDRRTWVLENHDRDRIVNRYGGGALGLRRARAAALLLLALPGSVYLYQGQELGLGQVELPDGALRDPIWVRSGHTQRGRDGCRVPLPWSGDASPYGFSPAGADDPWLPMPPSFAALSVQAQHGDSDSMLSLHRSALSLRRERLVDTDFSWLPSAPQVLAFRRGEVVCLVNAGASPAKVETGAALLGSHRDAYSDGTLASDSAVWLLRTDSRP